MTGPASTRQPLRETPSQTAGPFVHIGLASRHAGFAVYAHEVDAVLWRADVPGVRIRIEGRVLDGAGAPVCDALLECRQADAAGRYDPAGFRGFGRAVTDAVTGEYRFDTLKPGAVRDGDRVQAPHVWLWIVARGINRGLHTRLVFDDEPEANAADPVLAGVDPVRRATLIAGRVGADPVPAYRFDIVLQGAGETVFFAL